MEEEKWKREKRENFRVRRTENGSGKVFSVLKLHMRFLIILHKSLFCQKSGLRRKNRPGQAGVTEFPNFSEARRRNFLKRVFYNRHQFRPSWFCINLRLNFGNWVLPSEAKIRDGQNSGKSSELSTHGCWNALFLFFPSRCHSPLSLPYSLHSTLCPKFRPLTVKKLSRTTLRWELDLRKFLIRKWGL